MFTIPKETGELEIMSTLTNRELDVVRLLTESRTNAEIAKELVLSTETIKIHLKHIFQKLGVKTAARPFVKPPNFI